MFVYLKESEFHKKLFINKNFKQEVVKLIFDSNTPVHEVSDEFLADAIVKAFPKYLEKSKNKPSFQIKEEKKEPVSEPIPSPEPVIEESSMEEKAEDKVEETPEPEKEPEPVEEKKVRKLGRRKKNA